MREAGAGHGGFPRQKSQQFPEIFWGGWQEKNRMVYYC
jgi:hypothetical protein